eukprot:7380230-Prymnesium_polylepis.3
MWPTKPAGINDSDQPWQRVRGRGQARQTVCLLIPCDLRHNLGRVEADAKWLGARVVASAIIEAKGLLTPLALPPHVVGRREPAEYISHQPIAARVGLRVQQWRERACCGCEVQPRAAFLHVVTRAHAHEREAVQLVERVIERVLIHVKQPPLPQLLM